MILVKPVTTRLFPAVTTDAWTTRTTSVVASFETPFTESEVQSGSFD